MINIQIVYLALIFTVVFIVVFIVLRTMISEPLVARLKTLQKGNKTSVSAVKDLGTTNWVRNVVKLAGPISKIAIPKEGWEDSNIRIRFMQAGLRNILSLQLFFIAKILLTFLIPGVFIIFIAVFASELSPKLYLLLVMGLGALGYFMPNLYLQRRIAYRKREIFESFPDAMDLIVVCVESGLGLDAALAKVGDEIHTRSPILGEEFHLINLELRAGSSRERALKNLATRTGVEDIETLVSMLVQSDRFGTSVADSLRILADILRTKRKLRAEEAAAKIATKLLIPLIFCIMPALLVVLLGPAAISITHTLFSTAAGY
jgi:tight adherence protein C